MRALPNHVAANQDATNAPFPSPELRATEQRGPHARAPTARADHERHHLGGGIGLQVVLHRGVHITVRMLLNHTSGIFNYTTDATFLADLTKKWTPEELVQLAASHGALDPPGAIWKYSNTNYVCLGIIAEKVGGTGIAEQIRSELLTPQALEHTFFDGEETVNGVLAPGFSSVGTDSTYAVDPSGPWAAGAMVATVDDTGRWIEALVTGKVLSAAQQTQMETGTPIPNAPASYGLGLLMLDPSVTNGAGTAYGHDGGINGYHTHAFHFRESKTTIVAIVNQDGADVNEVTLAALLALFP